MAADPRASPTLILNPPDDVDFRVAAESLVGGGVDAPQALEGSLRKRWPAAVVRPRVLAGERADIWYVYRDGHWVRSG